MATNLMNYETNSLWGTGYYSGRNMYMGPRKTSSGFPVIGVKKKKKYKKVKKKWRRFG